MELRYYLNKKGVRVYTLSEKAPDGKPTLSAHPGKHSSHSARFSPDDQYSLERVRCKERFQLLPTQKEPLKF